MAIATEAFSVMVEKSIGVVAVPPPRGTAAAAIRAGAMTQAMCLIANAVEDLAPGTTARFSFPATTGNIIRVEVKT